jgi:hypothetical protein
MDKMIVYGLSGPDGVCRYIGKSERGLRRPREHGKEGHMSRYPHYPVVRWIKKLRANGSDYTISVMEECFTRISLAAAECRWIAELRSKGVPLLNITDGGEGTIGYRHTTETRARMSATRQKTSQETKAVAPKTPAGDFICEECNDAFDGRRCLNCKRNYAAEKKGEVVEACKTCLVVRRLYSNGDCRECLQMMGLRECAGCLCVLPQHLSFQAKQGTCGDCRNGLRRRRRADRVRRRRR